MSRKKYDGEFKKKIIKEHEGGASCYSLGQKYGIDAKCIRNWCRLQKQCGDSYFSEGHANINYSAEFKEMVVKSYLTGGKNIPVGGGRIQHLSSNYCQTMGNDV